MTTHKNAIDALRYAYFFPPTVIAYRQGAGWTTYHPTQSCPAGCEPELFVGARGCFPVPLSETGAEVWASILRELINGAAK